MHHPIYSLPKLGKQKVMNKYIINLKQATVFVNKRKKKER